MSASVVSARSKTADATEAIPTAVVQSTSEIESVCSIIPKLDSEMGANPIERIEEKGETPTPKEPKMGKKRLSEERDDTPLEHRASKMGKHGMDDEPMHTLPEINDSGNAMETETIDIPVEPTLLALLKLNKGGMESMEKVDLMEQLSLLQEHTKTLIYEKATKQEEYDGLLAQFQTHQSSHEELLATYTQDIDKLEKAQHENAELRNTCSTLESYLEGNI